MGSLRYEGNRLHSNEEEVAYTSDEGGTTTGDNENGSWTKFGDGTMMCWGQAEGGVVTTNGTLNYQIPVIFPMAFINDNITVTFVPIDILMPGENIANGPQVVQYVNTWDSQTCGLDLWTNALWMEGDQQNAHWVAVGRWRVNV